MGVRGRLQAEYHRAKTQAFAIRDGLLRMTKPKPRGREYRFDANVPVADTPGVPYVFASNVCREAHFRLPLFRYWCERFGERPRYHRKQWEWVYISQVLHERGMLETGRRGLGFGVGTEPLAAMFAERGAEILATDIDAAEARRIGWLEAAQHAGDDIAVLNARGVCDPKHFAERVRYRTVDMNDIPADLTGFDFCWSSCSFEHLGSLERGLEFVRRSIDCLRPGGVAVHTTEYKLGRGRRTLETEIVSLYRRSDFERLERKLAAAGHRIAPIDFEIGHEPVERYIDYPPWAGEPHLRLRLPTWLGGFRTTSIGLVVERSGRQAIQL